ncbi:MAG: SUMF1/EgtB/PvdO family nonheme iron enzyme [bacterium]
MTCNKCQINFLDNTNSLLCPECNEEISTSKNLPISAIDIVFEPHYQIDKRYEIISSIGRGGVGIVYKAKDFILDEIVALKVLAPGLSMNQEIVERFKQETKITRRLSHDNIIRIYDIGRFDNRWYISMEYVDGQDLKSILQERNILSPIETVGVIKQVLKALQVVHENQIINRDIKPQNILIRKDGIVKIGDFSIAKSAELNGLTSPDLLIVGSPEYMSPEQVKGEKIDARTDIYSVGIVMYELLTGKPPFGSDTLIAIAYKHIFETPISPKELNPQIPVWLDNITRKCLAKAPEKRYQEVKELLSDLEMHRVPKIDFEQKRDEITINKETFLKLKKITILSIIGIIIAVSIAGYFIQKYNKNQNTLQITQRDYAKKLYTLQTKLQNLEGVKQNLEAQMQIANQKIENAENEKKELITQLERVKSLSPKADFPIPSEMVLVEGGEFIMGMHNGDNTYPQRKVYLASFYIDKYEVTNEQYIRFLNAMGKHDGYINLESEYCKIEKPNGLYKVKAGYEKYPVVEVSWDGANRYARWAGKRLPTEAEWEKAARGTEGRKYPWGDIFDRNKCNISMQRVTPVGNFPQGKSPYGCEDMAGNVCEWVADWYDSNYYENSPSINPKGPNIGHYRVWRGGSYLGNQITTQCFIRNYLAPDKSRNSSGFRCARDAKER